MHRNSPVGSFPRRGYVYWVNLDKPRPALVISTDALNRHALDVCVVGFTTVERPQFSLRIRIPATDGGLPQNSWAKCDQVTTIPESLLSYPSLGRISESRLRQIEEAIRLALELL